MSMPVRVSVVGATGAVGREFLRLFEQRNWNPCEVRLFASPRSLGAKVPFRGGSLTVGTAGPGSFTGSDVTFFSAGSGISREVAPIAASEGSLVIDNSSAFRMDPLVPLVVPEINLNAIKRETAIIANPNCSTIILLMAVAPLRSLGRVRRIVVSTYQSASGAGWEAMEELRNQTGDYLAGRPLEPRVMPHPYAFNLFSHNTPIGADGYNEEERKMVLETRKILEDDEVGVSPTCVRVPVLRAHSESILVEFEEEAPSEDAAREALAGFPGVRVVDDREGNVFPMPLDASGGDEVLVGRIRRDMSNPRGLSLFACGDQLLKGAALNAVQIAEAVLPGRGVAVR